MTWMDEAACDGAPLDWFFAPEGRGQVPAGYYDRGLELCRVCPVRVECLRFCFEQRPIECAEVGVWGGTLPQERKRMNGKRRAAFIIAERGRPEWNRPDHPSRPGFVPDPEPPSPVRHLHVVADTETEVA